MAVSADIYLMMQTRGPAGAKIGKKVGLLTYPDFPRLPNGRGCQWLIAKDLVWELQQRVLSRICTVFQEALVCLTLIFAAKILIYFDMSKFFCKKLYRKSTNAVLVVGVYVGFLLHKLAELSRKCP